MSRSSSYKHSGPEVNFHMKMDTLQGNAYEVNVQICLCKNSSVKMNFQNPQSAAWIVIWIDMMFDGSEQGVLLGLKDYSTTNQATLHLSLHPIF